MGEKKDGRKEKVGKCERTEDREGLERKEEKKKEGKQRRNEV
jgi:hypothetical protein